jgi:hypothetical protein
MYQESSLPNDAGLTVDFSIKERGRIKIWIEVGIAMPITRKQESRDTNLDTEDDFLLIATLRVPSPYGYVLFPEQLGDFAEGDIVRYAGGKDMLVPEEGEDGGRGKLMKVAVEDCERVTDPEVAESLRLVILMR